MTSESKATITIDTSALADGLPLIAGSVTIPLQDIVDYIASKARAYASVSAADTHMKHIDDAIGVTGGGISKSIVNGGGNEQLRLTVPNTTAQWNADKIQGNAVDSGVPSTGQGYVWDGDSFALTDLTGGTDANANANKIQDNAVDAGTPSTGQGYVWDGDSFALTSLDKATAQWNADKIRGNAVDAGTPSTGQGYVWDGDSFALVNLTNTTSANTNASRIQGNAVDSGAPSSGQGYVWDGDSFALTSLDKDTAQWNANEIRGNAVDAGTPTTGQGYVWDGDSFALTSLDKDTAQWNANEIRGNAVDAGTPSTGQGYVWDGDSFALVDLTNATSANTNASRLQNRTVSNASPQVGDSLLWNGDAWVPGTPDVDAATIPNGIAEGRLTLTSNTPVTTADVSAAATLYYTPYKGNRIALYNGATWNIHTFSQLSISLAGFAGDTNLDVFVYDNAGTLTLSLEEWGSDTVRFTDIVRQDGVYVLTGATNKRYLGTIRTTSTLGQCEDSLKRRFVWNYNNRVAKRLYLFAGNSAYSGIVTRAYAGDTSLRFELVSGISDEIVEINGYSRLPQLYGGSGAQIGLSVDTSSSFNTDIVPTAQARAAGDAIVFEYNSYLSLGYHYLQLVETGLNLASDYEIDEVFMYGSTQC